MKKKLLTAALFSVIAFNAAQATSATDKIDMYGKTMASLDFAVDMCGMTANDVAKARVAIYQLASADGLN